MPSNRRSKDREAEHQRWADRQEITADLLRETVEAAGARAAEISEWLDSSMLPDDPDSVFAVNAKPPASPALRVGLGQPPDRASDEQGAGAPEQMLSGTAS